MEIKVSLATYKRLIQHLSTESDTLGDVVSRLLDASEAASNVQVNQEKVSKSEMSRWIGKGVELPVGTELRHVNKDGTQVLGVVERDGLRVGEDLYPSLSAAGRGVEGYYLNGWTYWRYLDSTTKNWEEMGRLRGKDDQK